MVDLLLKKGADLAIADFEGSCALDVATDAAIRRRLENAMIGSNARTESKPS